jgi:hypothetical protein
MTFERMRADMDERMRVDRLDMDKRMRRAWNEMGDGPLSGGNAHLQGVRRRFEERISFNNFLQSYKLSNDSTNKSFTYMDYLRHHKIIESRILNAPQIFEVLDFKFERIH